MRDGPAPRAFGPAPGARVAGVGIDAYQTEALWKPLSNAVNDVERVKATLVERYGFESPDPWVLTDDRATGRNISDLLDALRRDLQPDDNLIFFYAGHGAEVRDMVGGRRSGGAGISSRWT